MRVLLYLALTCSVHALQDVHQVKDGDPVASIKDTFSVVEDSSKEHKSKATVGGRKTKGSEGGDVVDASTDPFVAQQQLGPKGPHVDGKKGVLKTTSGAAKAIDTEASASWLETARVAATRFLGGDVGGGVEGVSETVTLSKGTAVDGEGFDVHRTPDENDDERTIARSPWFMRKGGYNKEPSGDYKANTWLNAQWHDGGWTDGQGFNFNARF